jgi:hypothetical protein
VTAVNPRQLGDALRACARGIHPLEAGTGLLIDCGSWLHREDFTSRFITLHPGISSSQPVAVIDWPAVIAALGSSLACSGASSGC